MIPVVILAGGYGTRISEYTQYLPKPMIEIGNIPLLQHIINHYASFGFFEFIIALGYKGDYIKQYFYSLSKLSGNLFFDFSTKSFQTSNESFDSRLKITLVETGIDAMTGGRLLVLRDYINSDTFMLTYGDGLSNIPINELVDFHIQSKSEVTISAVRPRARFGSLSINASSKVTNFVEKPESDSGWINGGYMVCHKNFLDRISDSSTVLEREPLERVASLGLLSARKHFGFWQCMDTLRDQKYLQSLFDNNEAPWII